MAGHIFDGLIVAISELGSEKHRELKVTETIRPGSTKLMVLLPPWHVTPVFWNRLQKQLLRQGYSLLTYEVSEDILSSDGRHVARSFKALKDAAVKDIARLRRSGQFKTVDVAGLSLGTVSALYIASSGVAINKLILVSPSDDVPDGIYYGKRSRKIRRELDAAGKNLDTYRQEMPELTMRKNYKLQVNHVEIVYAANDHVIPYWLSLQLIKSLKTRGITPQVIRRPYRGHYLTFILYCLAGRAPSDKN